MRASPRSGRNRSPPEPPRRSGFTKPHVGPVGAGVLAVLAGFPVLAQVGAFPPTEPAQEERLPTAEPEPTQAAPPRLRRALRRLPRLRSGSAPTRFPVLSAAVRRPPVRLHPAPPRLSRLRSASVPIFSPAFSAAGRTGGHSEQPALPPSEPGISPGVPWHLPGTPSGVPTAPATAPSEAAPSPDQGAPVSAPQPGLATTPDLTPPFVAPPYGFGNLGVCAVSGAEPDRSSRGAERARVGRACAAGAGSGSGSGQ